MSTVEKLKKLASAELPSHASAAIFGLAAYAALFAGIVAASSLGIALA